MVVLVGFASAHGSTRGIAERLAARLRYDQISAEARSVTQIESLTGFEAVVLGSAIHDQAWLPEAVRFVRENAAALSGRPVWLFSVGMPGALPRVLRRWAMREGPKVLAEIDAAAHSRGQRLFSGVIRPDQFPLISRVVFRLMGARWGDYRDWAGIDEWADQIAGELRQVAAADRRGAGGTE